MHPRVRRRFARFLFPVVLLGLPREVPATTAQMTVESGLPYSIGEVLTYRAESGRFGRFGEGTMRVVGWDEVRGSRTVALTFDFRGRVGFLNIRDQTASWITPDGRTSLRYRKRERSPLRTHEEDVEIFPDEARWASAEGPGGRIGTAQPLDELSFLYFVRTLPLRDGDSYTFARHFDTARNPALVRVLRREITRVPAGEFHTVVVEVNVKGDGVLNGALRLYLTDDSSHTPVRLESSAPWIGSTRLLLESVVPGELIDP
jgi:hypothetical protein